MKNKTRKISTLLLSVLAGAVLVGGAGQAQAADLTVVGWGGTTQAAHKVAYFDPFTKETGVKIVEDEWNGEMAKIRGMVETGNVTWDRSRRPRPLPVARKDCSSPWTGPRSQTRKILLMARLPSAGPAS